MDKTEKPSLARMAMEKARARRLGERAAGRARQRRMAEVGLETRPVRRALARMGRPQGRKGAKASIVVARSAAEKVNEARDRARAFIRVGHARAGVMPHVPKDPSKKVEEALKRATWRSGWAQRV